MKLLIAYDGTAGAVAAIKDLQFAGLPTDCQVSVMSVADVWTVLLDEVPPDDVNPELVKRAQEHAREALERAHETSRKGSQLVAELFPTWRVSAAAHAAWLPRS